MNRRQCKFFNPDDTATHDDLKTNPKLFSDTAENVFCFNERTPSTMEFDYSEDANHDVPDLSFVYTKTTNHSIDVLLIHGESLQFEHTKYQNFEKYALISGPITYRLSF